MLAGANTFITRSINTVYHCPRSAVRAGTETLK